MSPRESPCRITSQPATRAPKQIKATLSCVPGVSTLPLIQYSVNKTMAVAVRRTQRNRGMFTSAMPYHPTTMLATFRNPGHSDARSTSAFTSGTSNPDRPCRNRFASTQNKSEMPCCAASSRNLPW
jgi:hypothetical protein